MIMTLKKVCKHSVVYETDDDTAPASSIYVSKLYLAAQGAKAGEWPKEIDLSITVRKQ